MSNPLVSTEWLHEHLHDSDIRIIDIRGHVLPAIEPPPHYFNHEADYLKSHIPGALFVDWVHEITDPSDPRHAQIAKPERFAAAMTRLGITPQTLVIAYDDAAGMFAARLWWALRYYGHERVVVLDGGWNKWIAEGRPITDEIPKIVPVPFSAQPDLTLIRSADQVMERIGMGARLIDVRTVDEYEGRASRAVRMGHIPSAKNIPRAELIAADGRMLPPEALRERFAKAGVNEQTSEVITYCNGGVSASFGLLALTVAGIEPAAIYDGSWKDWGNDPSRPIE